MTEQKSSPSLIPPHGEYRDLKSYQTAEIVHDATILFCDRFINKRSRTRGNYLSSHGEREGKTPTALPGKLPARSAVACPGEELSRRGWVYGEALSREVADARDMEKALS